MRAIVTGAAGFAGMNLVECLIAHNFFVYAVVRPGSDHNIRLSKFSDRQIRIVELNVSDIDKLSDIIPDTEKSDFFFHFAWFGERNDFETQSLNIYSAVSAVKCASKLRIRRIIMAGSQAEYGVKKEVITESSLPAPFSAYGTAKLAACYLTRELATQLNVEWVWGRIFSLIGKYEPAGRMIPDLINNLKNGVKVNLSSCRQMWDYLDASDCAEAFLKLAEYGKPGEIYNVASGDCHELKWYVKKIASLFENANVSYDGDPNPFVTLNPSIQKIVNDTGWKYHILFADSINDNYMN